ncbi:MAG TPA: LacI family DNA-binding transcriptional regulator [Steroidobacteraceae bacterium]|jgi:LacI family transcriptional regulator|nr:LacI family DNA-binding transcriptional regulator [Steroidobacteraceae bacterium]
MATVKDIAAAVGVSVATVSNVLNGRPNVGRVNRQKVLRAAKRLGYRPNRAAQAMRTGRTRAIGLVLPDLTNPFFPELAQAVENTARGLGLLVCLVDSQGRAAGEADGFALLMQHAVDGIIWCPVGPRLPPYLRDAARPVVLIDRPRPGFPVVHSDYLMGGRLLAEYALRMGHRCVGLLSGPQNLASARQRRDGLVEAFPQDIRIAWEVVVGFDGILNADAVRALQRRGKATLIVAGNDLIAISAIRCLAEAGVHVPADVSITGFDNIRWTDVVTPRLTTIAQPVGAIGAKAVQLMQQRMAGEKIANRPTIFDVTLIERDSVRRN